MHVPSVELEGDQMEYVLLLSISGQNMESSVFTLKI